MKLEKGPKPWQEFQQLSNTNKEGGPSVQFGLPYWAVDRNAGLPTFIFYLFKKKKSENLVVIINPQNMVPYLYQNPTLFYWPFHQLAKHMALIQGKVNDDYIDFLFFSFIFL